MKRFLAAGMIALLLLASGCECISGLGRDMQKAGNWVEKKAKENQ